MKALILAGGFGTRLRPLSCTRPKILFPITNKPLLQLILERLAKSNVNEVIMAVSYRTENLIRQFRGPKYGIKLTYSRDPLKRPLGTGGPIKKAERLVGHEENFFVLNEDIFAEIDYTEILKAQAENEENAVATIALHKVKNPERYGVAELAEGKRITGFIEKPPPATATSNLVNAGVYVLSPEIFKYIPKGRGVSLEREVFPKLAEESKLNGYIFDGLWMDIGKLEDYLKINKILLDSVDNQQEFKVGSKVKVKKPVTLDKGVSLGEKSVIGPYVVIGRNTTVGKNVHIENSVILPSTVISDFSSINGAIIGESVVIGKRVNVGEGCVLGDHVRVKDNVSLTRGVSICPAKDIHESVLTPKNII